MVGITPEQRARARARTFWLIALLDVLFLPIIMFSFLSGREQTSLVDRLLSITGTQAAGLLLFVVALGTRARSKAAPFGIPLHRWVGLSLVALVIIHVTLAMITNPDNYQLLLFWDAPPRGAAATGALIFWLCVIGLGEYRKHSQLPHDKWRLIHSGLAWLGSIFAFAHILWIDQLVNSGAWLLLFAGILVTAFYLWLTRAKGVSKSRATEGHVPRIVGWALVLVAILTIGMTVVTWKIPGVFTIGYVQNDSGPIGPADRDMLYKVKQAGLWEMPVGEEVKERGSSPELREVGRKINEEHHQLNAIITDAANQLGIPLPTEPTIDQKRWMSEIHYASDADFDSDAVYYLRAAHGKVLPLLAQVRTGTRNDVIRTMADISISYVSRHIGYLESTGLVNFAQMPEPPAPSPYQAPTEASYFDTHEVRSIVVTSVIVVVLSGLLAVIALAMLKPKTATRPVVSKAPPTNGNGNASPATVVTKAPRVFLKPRRKPKPTARHRKP
jgi:predicted outer membrane protein